MTRLEHLSRISNAVLTPHLNRPRMQKEFKGHIGTAKEFYCNPVITEEEKALSEGQTRFIGKCDRHGKSEFKIYKNHGAVFYKCVECSNAASKIMNSRDKDDCLANSKNTFIREWFEKNKHVKKKDLFTKLGWSKSSFNHYTSGRAICPDDKYEAFVELVKKLESNNEKN